jgi:lipopolysaccharide export system protein LptA
MKQPGRITQTPLFALLGLALVLVPPGALAEKADRNKPIEMTAASGTSDLANNVQTLEGTVVLVQGTMRMTAERMRVKRDAQDRILAELFGTPTAQITFREKREGFDDFMEGVADRAEFDDRSNTIKLFGRARLKNGGDELTGEYIYYNSVSEVIQALGRIPEPGDAKRPPDAGAGAGSASPRVRIVIQPRQSGDTKPAADAKPAPNKK